MFFKLMVIIIMAKGRIRIPISIISLREIMITNPEHAIIVVLRTIGLMSAYIPRRAGVIEVLKSRRRRKCLFNPHTLHEVLMSNVIMLKLLKMSKLLIQMRSLRKV